MKHWILAGLVVFYFASLNTFSGLFFYHWIERNHVGVFIALMTSANILGTAMFYGICQLYTEVLNTEPIRSIVYFLDNLGVIFFLIFVTILSYVYLLFLGLLLTLLLAVVLVCYGFTYLNRRLASEQD